MSDKRQLGAGGVATVRKPRVLVAGGTGFAARAADQFRAKGWDVYSVAVADDVLAAVLARKPAAVMLPAEPGGESGYLIAAKLKKARPKLKVVLVGVWTPEAERFARFVGATLMAESDGVVRLVDAVTR